MFQNAEVVFGTVVACSEENALTIQMETGATGIVEKNEVTRRELRNVPNFQKMVGRRMGFVTGGTDEQGRRILSGKAYENHLYEEIVHAYQHKERNVYRALYISTTQDGKLAFYALAQGVTGAVSVMDFANTRVRSFHDILLPREMTVAIKEVDIQGRIQLYAKIGFPDFAQSVDKLNLVEGSVTEGYVSSFVPSNGDAIVTLAPNLTVLANHAPMGSKVRVKVKRILADENRLKVEMISQAPGQYNDFCFADWCVDTTAYSTYIDIEAFEKRIRTCVKRLPALQQESNKEQASDLSYHFAADFSPFAIRKGERAERLPLSGGTTGGIVFEVQHGYLTQEHMKVAKAINTLKFSTSNQLQLFLDCTQGLRLSSRKLWNILKRLVKHDIIHELVLFPGEELPSFKVFYPGAINYTRYTGELRNLPTWSYSAEPDATYIKYCLSLNHLLLGMLHGWNNIDQCEYRCYLQLEGKPFLRPHCKVTLNNSEGNIYVESARSNWLDETLDKLKRYDRYFTEMPESEPKVIITLEDQTAVEAFASRVAALRLKYEVLLTSDVECLPVPVVRSISASITEVKEGFWQKLRLIF